MIKTILCFCTAILLFNLAIGQDQMSLEEFENFCDSSGLIFELPEGYHKTAVKENNDLWYAFAVTNEDSTLEIRYTIWSLQPSLEQYDESLKDSNSFMIPPNNIYKGRVQANVLNMTGGKMYEIQAFPTEAVQEEYHADAGGSSLFEFDCDFGKGYRFGQSLYLHKDDVADVIVTFMSNDLEAHSEMLNTAFYSLKFK